VAAYVNRSARNWQFAIDMGVRMKKTRLPYVLLQHHVKQLLRHSVMKSGFTVSVIEKSDDAETAEKQLSSMQAPQVVPSSQEND
jgi:hypothetical protein